ncbi:PREDICTED: kinesin-like protein KIF18B [Chinchilla lanigera]|uniref:Kinesin-like protein n=1 Tax=Chinchilla lanigera TaxID=34839 RepID=A0A8C2W7C2_CHILA|nr:PREDICTED: kinesin-like protein KIF18B [Chinchilla lanigera]
MRDAGGGGSGRALPGPAPTSQRRHRERGPTEGVAMVTAAEDSVVRVVVRVRPPTPRELEVQRPPVVQVVDDRVLVFDPEEPTGGLPALNWGSTHSGPKRKSKGLTFIFDRVFGEGATQQDVFRHTTHGLLDSFLQGYNCSVFAYGATGAGKTHTMLGRHGDPGIMCLTTMELYQRLEALREEKQFEVLVSYLEVYNEQIHDLLEPKGPLNIREDSDKSVVVQGLSFHQPTSAEQLLEMLSRGNCSRTQHPTDANATSSRSHAIFQIFVRQQDRVPGPTQALQMAKMSLIDLAGSERASSTHARGERLREGANINRSLLALISVLNALADAKGRRAHVPYRDSKLTRLLKDSLGGNCRTVMIAHVSPAALAYEDTYNTLKYADRAKEIRLTLKSNVVTLDCHVSRYAAVCQQLQAEVSSLRRKLQELEARAQAPQRSLSPPSQSCTPESGTLRDQSQGTEAQEPPALAGSSAGQGWPPRSCSQDRGPAEVPGQVPEPNPRPSVPGMPSLILPPEPASAQLSLKRPRGEHLGPLALRVLHLAQKQYALLQAAGLLTPDLTTELEMLQQLVHEADGDSSAESCRTPGLAQELCSDSRSPGHCSPVTRTMARRQSSLLHNLGVPPGPDGTPAPVSRQPTEKRRRPSPSAPDSPLAPRREAKRQRQSSLPCLRQERQPEPCTPAGARASPSCRSPRPCPATVIKRRAPLGPSALQNCSTRPALPTLDLNATFDLSEEPPSTLSLQEFAPHERPGPRQAFVASGPAALFTARGPKPTSSLPGTSACRRRRPASSCVPQGRSRIARLPSSSWKRPAGALVIPEQPLRPKTQKKLAGVGRLLPTGDCVAQVS